MGKAPRERLTLIRLFEELRGCGYDGGYDAVRRYARRRSNEGSTREVGGRLSHRGIPERAAALVRLCLQARRALVAVEAWPHASLRFGGSLVG